MNIRQAILAAADHIERNPAYFIFEHSGVPSNHACGTPGCAMGWIGHFYGADRLPTTKRYNDVLRVLPLLGFEPFTKDNLGRWCSNEFYDRMDGFADDWKSSPVSCVFALRLYADKYYPGKVITPPNWRAIAAHQSIPESAVDEMVRA